jgi:hypothetical protein
MQRMRHATGWIAALMIAVTSVAVAQQMPQGVPPGADPATGARPGNEIGTGASGPFSNNSSNIGPQDTTSTIAPNLPSPNVGEGASPRRYLEAARTALLVGRTGEAQQALEMAETRALDQSVPLFQTGVPSKNPLVGEIQQALDALGHGDRGQAVKIVEAAIPHAE